LGIGKLYSAGVPLQFWRRDKQREYFYFVSVIDIAALVGFV